MSVKGVKNGGWEARMSYDGSGRMTRIVVTAGSGANPFPWPRGTTSVTCDGNGNVTQLWGRNIDNGTIWKVEQEFDYEQRLTPVNEALYPELGRAVTGWFRLTHLNGAGGGSGGAAGPCASPGEFEKMNEVEKREVLCKPVICCCYNNSADRKKCAARKKYAIAACLIWDFGINGAPTVYIVPCGGDRKPPCGGGCGCTVACNRVGEGKNTRMLLVVSCKGSKFGGCSGYVDPKKGEEKASDCWAKFQSFCGEVANCKMPCASSGSPSDSNGSEGWPPSFPPCGPDCGEKCDKIVEAMVLQCRIRYGNFGQEQELARCTAEAYQYKHKCHEHCNEEC